MAMADATIQPALSRRLLRWVLYLGLGLVLVVALLFVAMKVASEPVPRGQAGQAADALAHKVEAAVNMDAWAQTGAVRFNFMGRNQHLWDKRGNRHHVRFGDNEVVIDLGTRRGCARTNGQPQSGASAEKLLTKGYALWVNDTFWFNPLGKFFDPGVLRKVVDVPGHGAALLITFTANGLTPGDSYLWLLDAQGRPNAWRMWTKIPLGGAEATWEGWQKLSTGAWVSTRHKMLGLSLDLTDVGGAASLSELLAGQPDPFLWCKVR